MRKCREENWKGSLAGTVRTFRQKAQENLIQISSDYLPSVTKYEAPANAIEQKSTKQKVTLSRGQGTTGFV